MLLSIRIIILVLGLCIFFGIFYFLIRRKTYESVGIIWIIVGLLAMLSAIFPQMIDHLANFLQIDYPPTLVLVLLVCFLMYLAYRHTHMISMQEAQINELAIQISMLKEKLYCEQHIRMVENEAEEELKGVFDEDTSMR